MLDMNVINEAFGKLDEELNKENVKCCICIYGGSALTFIYDLRHMTHDVDYRIVSAFYADDPKRDVTDIEKAVRRAIRRVGQELDLSDEWMNDGVKGFVSANEEFMEDETAYSNGALVVLAPSPEYLFAMKAMSMRNLEDSPNDRRDLEELINILHIDDQDAALEIVERFYPARYIQPKTVLGLEMLLNEKRSDESGGGDASFP